MILGVQEEPIPDSLERGYCSEDDVLFVASGLGIDFGTVWGSSFTTADVCQIEALEIERLTGRYFFQVRHTEVFDGGFKYLIPNHLPIIAVEKCYAEDDPNDSLLPYIIVSPYRIRAYSEFPSGLNNITLVYIAGYQTVPQHIRWANAIGVVIRALGTDPNWIAMVVAGGSNTRRGERLTVGPVTMEEGGIGLDGLKEIKLNRMIYQYVTAIQQEQTIDMKTTSREDRYKRHHEWLYEEQWQR